MNSTFLRVLAILMVIAAIVTAWLGYRTSNKKPMDTLAVVVPSYSHIVARGDIPAGHVLTANDLEVITTQQQDKQTFSDTHSLIGKVTTMPVMKGATFKASHFPTLSLLGQALAPHQRAVAIKVNEVIGVGGFIKPGDHVDVLLYLRADRENGEVSSAQVVLSNVKVLAYGALISEMESRKEDAIIPPTSNKLGTSNSSSDSKHEKDSRSAILAVAEQEVSKLMLADSTGVLRLALRGGPSSATSASTTTDNQFIRLGDVSQSSSVPISTPSNATAVASAVTAKNKSTSSTSKRERVIIHRGDQLEVVNVSR
jgi:pilus assembly protein CpaB